MTTISILPEPVTESGTKFRAISGNQQSLGKTPGEALDSITAQLNDQESGTLIVVQKMRPDRFFSEAQQLRLAELMVRWRAARESGATLPTDEAEQLDLLVSAELEATRQRSLLLYNDLQP